MITEILSAVFWYLFIGIFVTAFIVKVDKGKNKSYLTNSDIFYIWMGHPFAISLWIMIFISEEAIKIIRCLANKSEIEKKGKK